MAKPNKNMWTGVDIVTSLSPEQVRLAVLEQVADSKGRIELVSDTPLMLGCAIMSLSGTVKFGFGSAKNPWVSFDIQISDEFGGKRAVRSHVTQALLKDSSVPFAPKVMSGYDAYMRFVRGFASHLSARDNSASVTYREGSMPPGFPLESLESRVAPPQ